MAQPAAINTTATWCSVCGNTKDRGCGDLALAAAQARTHQRIGPVGAGFLGAGVTLALVSVVCAMLFLLGILRLGRARRIKQLTPTRGSDVSTPVPHVQQLEFRFTDRLS